MGMGFYLRMALVFCGLVLSSCLKPPSYEQDFGSEVSREAILKALNEAPYPSPYTIEPGEFAYFDKLQTIENLNPNVVAQRGHTIMSKVDRGDHYLLTMVTETKEWVDGAMKPSRKESELVLPKMNIMALALWLQSPATLLSAWTKPWQQDPALAPLRQVSQERQVESWSEKVFRLFVAPSSEGRISYHNLKVEELIFPVPLLVSRRVDCGGLTHAICQGGIPAQKVSFDMVRWESRGGDKSSFYYIYSDRVPYLAGQLEACAESKIDYQGQRVRVRQCERAQDFTMGSKPAGQP